MPPALDLDLHLRSYGREHWGDRHDFAQLVLPVEGEVLLDIEERRARLDPLLGALIAPGAWHAQSSQADNHSLIVDVDAAAFAGGPWQELLARPFTPLAPAARKLVDFMGILARQSPVAGALVNSWVPLLLSFALLILDSVNGQWLIATLLLLAVANDTFGYIVGVLIGKHPMAPKISPKKSWEGFAGSMAGSMAIGACAMHFWMDMPWWTGVILAFFTTIAATTGDFSESMVKRELGIKDMSNLLPGHGGIMDRLDSVLFVIPLGYVISHVLAWSVAVF